MILIKKCLSIAFWVLFTLLLVGCIHRTIYPTTDLTHEKWQSEVQTRSDTWKNGADTWFFNGRPNQTERRNQKAPDSDVISTMIVRVPNFTKIDVRGGFQVQIFGADEQNTVSLIGPNAQVRAVAVDVNDNTLLLSQTTNVPGSTDKVIVRIGIKRLNKLVQSGCSKIETAGVVSKDLELVTTPSSCGSIYLSGDVKIKRIEHGGDGSINIFNAYTPSLAIKTFGSGALNISGKIGVETIDHSGAGNISIIGANTTSLCILASGSGTISVKGILNLKEVVASGATRVYVDTVNSDTINATASNNARIGLTGGIRSLNLNTLNESSFEGRHLRVQEAFVKAAGTSHVNVTAKYKIFASAAGSSSIYYYGPARLISKFESQSGSVIPLGFDYTCTKSNTKSECARVSPDFMPGAG